MLKPHVRICLAAFTLDFAIMVGMTVTPFFVAKQLGGSAQTMGAFGAVGAAVYAATALASAGFVSRAKNGLLWAVAGIVVYAVFYSIMVLFGDWRICLLVSCIASAAMALVWPALHSWVGAESDPAARARTRLVQHFGSFGFALSPLLAGRCTCECHYRLWRLPSSQPWRWRWCCRCRTSRAFRAANRSCCWPAPTTIARARRFCWRDGARRLWPIFSAAVSNGVPQTDRRPYRFGRTSPVPWLIRHLFDRGPGSEYSFLAFSFRRRSYFW